MERLQMTQTAKNFASMNKDKQRMVAQKGGQVAHQKGVAHEFTSREAKKAGKKGGMATAKTHGSDFFSKIGRKGGIGKHQKEEEPLEEGGE